MNDTKPKIADLNARQISLCVIGERSPKSKSTEVCILSFLPWREGQPAVLAKSLEMQKSWIADDEVVCEQWIHSGAMKTLKGEVTFPCELYRTVNVLSHPYSGILEVKLDGELVGKFDLFSPVTKIRSLHLDELLPHVEESNFISPRPSRNSSFDSVIIRATGLKNSHSKMAEVFLLEFRPNCLDSEVIHLHELELDQGWLKVHDVNCGNSIRHGALKSTGGALSLPVKGLAVIELLSHPYAGIVEIEYAGKVVKIDLYSGTTHIKRFELDSFFSNLPFDRRHLARSTGHAQMMGVNCRVIEDTNSENPFHSVTTDTLAVTTPRWKGVTAATKNYFAKILLIPESPEHHPDQVDDYLIDLAATQIIASNLSNVVFSGGELFYLEIARRVRRRDPSIRFFNLWHSNYLQTGEEHDWRLFREWLNASTHEGLITRIAVVRKGYERYLQRLGFDACFIPNCLPTPSEPIIPTTNRDTVGIWLSGSSSYRKHPEAMILAAASIPGIKIKISGATPRVADLLADNEVEVAKLYPQPIPPEKLFGEIKTTALSLYITASECSPVVPLESFAQGVPCIVGSNSHLYEGNKILCDNLVVENIGSPSEIADRIRSAMDLIPLLVEEYQKYNDEMVSIAKSNLAQLLRVGED